jgi:hypothetical protein
MGLRSWFRRALALFTLAAALLFAGGAQAGFLYDSAAFVSAMSALRPALGAHPRVLRITIAADRVVIEAQDPHNLSHVDSWQYATVNVLRIFPLSRLTGPEPVTLSLVNPDLEANLFDLDAVDLSALPKTISAAVARAQLQDTATAAVTYIEITRQTFILPNPSSGDVRWTLHVASRREHADIYADAKGILNGADVSATRRAQTLNLLNDPAPVADAATAFRAAVGAGPVLTKIAISADTVSFTTNVRDDSMAKIGFSMPAVQSYTWDLSGLKRRLGEIDTNAMGAAGPPPFGIDDVNFAVLPQLERDALARIALPTAKVTEAAIAKVTDQPGGPALAWTVEIREPSGEKSSAIADVQGAIQRVVLPANRQPKLNWLDPATIAGAIARIGPTFGTDAKIASIVFDDGQGRVTVDDRDNGGRPSTFEFSPDGVTRATISFMLDSMGPRFGVADVAPVNEQVIAALEAQALQRLGAGRMAWLESVTIGGHPFVRQAGARAIEVRVRDRAQDSVQANYAWVVFDFSGKVLDVSTF